ncbi:MAG TPA: aminotransferase class III-fold pyridoxal phosphate-dependent enzyme, partial [Polyangia bacterium]|nr:aminotransferase class III-fold pyridoxal phosphate-dependent enzyme [Polyangia bacterium]
MAHASTISTLKEIFGAMSGLAHDDIATDVSFLELGADSLLMVQSSQAIHDRFGVTIPVRFIVEENPTIAALADFIDQALPKPAPAVAVAPPASIAPVAITALAALPAIAPLAVSSAPAGLEALFARQLQIIAEQLEILREGGHAVDAIAAAPAIVNAAPSAAVVSATSSPPTPPAFNLATTASGQLDARQRAHLDALSARHAARTRGSKALAQSDRAALSDSNRVVGFRPFWKEMVYLLALDRGDGAHVWDIDGNEYVDLAMGFGALIFGHSPPFVLAALRRQAERGLLIGGESQVVGQSAQLLCRLTGMERASFCNSGTEAIMGAIRLARTVTGRDRIAFFTGAYHGWSNEILARPVRSADGSLRATSAAPGVPRGAADDALVLEYGTPESLAIIRAHAHELACVLVEPVQSRRPQLQPVEFLRELRRITTDAGCALVFDEVVTGFRVHPRGCQGLFDIEADLATYGKALGGGVPVAAIAGKARFLDAIDGGDWRYGDASYPQAERTFLSGTYHKHPLYMDAVCETLQHLERSGGALQAQLTARTTALVESLRARLARLGAPIDVVQFGSLFRFAFPREIAWSEIFLYQMLDQGIYLRGTGNNFLSTAHSDADLAKVESAVQAAVEQMIAGGFIPQRALTVAKPPAEQPNEIATTAAQRDLWVAAQLSDAAGSAYNESFSLHLRGGLDRAALHEALQALTARHEILRARFADDGAVMHIAPTLDLPLPLVDFAGGADRDPKSDDRVEAWLRAEAGRAFDLGRAPLLRAALLRLDERHHVLVLTLHHLVTDGWSNAALVEELGRLYLAARRLAPVPALPSLTFRDYVSKQAALAGTPELATAERFWLDRFAGPLPRLDLPSDRPRPPRRRFLGSVERLVLDAPLVHALTRTGGQHGATLFATLLTAFKTLLHRLSGQSDLVVGIVTAGQAAMNAPNLLGYCVNLLPIRTTIAGDPSFADYLALVRKTLLESLEQQAYSFSRLIEALQPPRDPSRSPLVNVVFNMDRKPPAGPPLDDVTVEVAPNHGGAA